MWMVVCVCVCGGVVVGWGLGGVGVWGGGGGGGGGDSEECQVVRPCRWRGCNLTKFCARHHLASPSNLVTSYQEQDQRSRTVHPPPRWGAESLTGVQRGVRALQSCSVLTSPPSNPNKQLRVQPGSEGVLSKGRNGITGSPSVTYSVISGTGWVSRPPTGNRLNHRGAGPQPHRAERGSDRGCGGERTHLSALLWC